MAAVNSAAASLPDDASERPLEEFMGSELSLSLMEQAKLIPDPDPGGIGAINVGKFTQARDQLIQQEGKVPSYVIFKLPGKTQHFISGIAAYLKKTPGGSDADFLNRIKSRDSIRNELLQIDKGHNLELIAAAIFSNACSYGQATAGSGDQGIDAVAWKELLTIGEVFMEGLAGSGILRPGNRVYFVASSKATIDPIAPAATRTRARAQRKVISPAHIRELVGSWLIQRSSVGAWAGLGLQMLTPLQLVLVTTYRLSAESQQDCHQLGVQVWGLPELTYLICKYAPANVFSGRRGSFSPPKFKEWWEAKQIDRLNRSFAAAVV